MELAYIHMYNWNVRTRLSHILYFRWQSWIDQSWYWRENSVFSVWKTTRLKRIDLHTMTSSWIKPTMVYTLLKVSTIQNEIIISVHTAIRQWRRVALVLLITSDLMPIYLLDFHTLFGSCEFDTDERLITSLEVRVNSLRRHMICAELLKLPLLIQLTFQ